MLKKYDVDITYTVTETFHVVANGMDEAYEIGRQKWNSGAEADEKTMLEDFDFTVNELDYYEEN